MIHVSAGAGRPCGTHCRTGPALGSRTVGAPQRSRSDRRSHPAGARRLLSAALVVVLTTIGASSGILWLTAHLLPHATGRGDHEPPVADAVELLKVALAVGMSKWAQAV